MSHPSQETWMSYLYDELSPRDRDEAERHLQQCEHCRGGVERWRGTMAVLDTDRVQRPLRVLTKTRSTPAFQWAAVAAVVAVLLGFALGRYSGVSRAELQTEVARVRESVSQELRDQYREDLREVARSTVAAAAVENRELLARVVGEFNQARAVDRRDWMATLDRLEEKRESQYISLKAGVVDLARSTRSGFLQTENNLNLLAATLPIDGGEPADSTQDPSSVKEKLP